MAGEALPPDVTQFIFRYLSSVEELEILLLLERGRTEAWTVETVYQVVLSSRNSVGQGLDKFAAAGLLAKTPASPPTYAFRATGEDPTIREVGRCYRELPVRVIEAIYQKNRDSVQGFADAFKFKRES
jgi:hypothetical protein